MAKKGKKCPITNGNINEIYEAGEFGYLYETDSKGRIINAIADPLKISGAKRLMHSSNPAGKLEFDHAGHIIADRFGGSPELDNIIAQAKDVNLSDYKKLENSWATAIKEGKEVKVDIEIKYDEDKLRPDVFHVKSWIDGEIEYKKIANINKK